MPLVQTFDTGKQSVPDNLRKLYVIQTYGPKDFCHSYCECSGCKANREERKADLTWQNASGSTAFAVYNTLEDAQENFNVRVQDIRANRAGYKETFGIRLGVVDVSNYFFDVLEAFNPDAELDNEEDCCEDGECKCNFDEDKSEECVCGECDSQAVPDLPTPNLPPVFQASVPGIPGLRAFKLSSTGFEEVDVATGKTISNQPVADVVAAAKPVCDCCKGNGCFCCSEEKLSTLTPELQDLFKFAQSLKK